MTCAMAASSAVGIHCERYHDIKLHENAWILQVGALRSDMLGNALALSTSIRLHCLSRVTSHMATMGRDFNVGQVGWACVGHPRAKQHDLHALTLHALRGAFDGGDLL